jgi:hypothetical protein
MSLQPIVLGLALALGTALAAAQSPAPSPTPAASPSPSPRPSARPKVTQRLTRAEAEALVKEISAEVEKIRGLKFKTPVDMVVIDAEAAREEYRARLNPWVEVSAKHTQEAYIQLGLIPRSADLLAGYLDLVERGVLGYYEPGSRKFYLLSHVDADLVRPVMAHELTHALEDQHYDLAALGAKAEGDDDRATALTAVIEGSATVVMMAYATRTRGLKKAREVVEETEAERARRLRRAPSFTQRSLMAPYILGITFLLRGKPWEWFYDGVKLDDIDQAYKEPPRSTRQILHPEQYWVGRAFRPQENPLSLPNLAPGLGPEWSKAMEGSIGELGLAVMTGSKLDLESGQAIFPSNWTHAASEGLLSDVFHHYVAGERRATVLLTRWESEDDAREFEAALPRRGRGLYRFNTSVLLLAGEFAGRGEELALRAFQGAKYWGER